MCGDWAGFAYPLTLIDEAGSSVTVNSDEELDELLLDCFGYFQALRGTSIWAASPEHSHITCILYDFPVEISQTCAPDINSCLNILAAEHPVPAS